MRITIECTECRTDGEQTDYKGNAAVQCPDCGHLLFVDTRAS